MTTIDESSETPRRARKNKSTDGQEMPETAVAETAAGETAVAVETPETAAMSADAPVEPVAGAPAAMSGDAPAEPVADAPAAVDAPAAADAPAADAPAGHALPAPDPESERRRIREQLDVLERKQSELRRALAIADHPALGEAIRVVEGRVYAVTRAEAKMAQGLSKGEERRRETLEKKLTVARAKRDELDGQIAELERELAPLGVERMQAFEAERREAIETLMGVISAQDAAFAAAGLELTTLVPELARFMPEIKTIAEEIVARGRA